MPIPGGLQSVSVALPGALRADGSVRRGSITFEPEPAVVTAAQAGALFAGAVTVAYDGASSPGPVTLLAVDSTDIQPTGWTYRVTEHWHDAPGRSYPISLPASAPTVKLAELAPTTPASGEYTVITGPRGLQGEPGPQGAQGPQGNQGVQGAPGPQGVQGMKGDQGAQGLQGVQGAQGPKGADGWGTQATYDALAARVSAVEAGFTTVNGFITDALNRVAGLESRMTAVEARVAELENP
ncbi:hypothetical protein [Kitasatospora sp. NPDC056184]|uniref:hypothetical protein n=1 Tax=Kitasatospora sp. NPDC056184 TaxID=3345738 RepID=UPI0035E1F9BE